MHNGEENIFYLNEDISAQVTSDSRDLPGEIALMGDTGKVKDLAVCYEDPSTQMLVKIKDLDPTKAHFIDDNVILRLRYNYHGCIEEARFIYSEVSSARSANQNQKPTTPRMRRIQAQQLDRKVA